MKQTNIHSDSFWPKSMVRAGLNAQEHRNPWERGKRLGQIRIRMYMRAGRRDYMGDQS